MEPRGERRIRYEMNIRLLCLVFAEGATDISRTVHYARSRTIRGKIQMFRRVDGADTSEAYSGNVNAPAGTPIQGGGSSEALHNARFAGLLQYAGREPRSGSFGHSVTTSPDVNYVQPRPSAFSVNQLTMPDAENGTAFVQSTLEAAWISPDLVGKDETSQAVVPAIVEAIQCRQYEKITPQRADMETTEALCSKILVDAIAYDAIIQLNESGRGSLRVLCCHTGSVDRFDISWAPRMPWSPPKLLEFNGENRQQAEFMNALLNQIGEREPSQELTHANGIFTRIYKGVRIDNKKWYVSSIRPSAYSPLQIVARAGRNEVAFLVRGQ